MKNNDILISVVMSVYNGAEFIRETIDSVLNQSHTNFEFMITDNASQDDTVSIINSYNDKRIRLFVNDVNKGYVVNLNNMIRKSSGKYIVRQDADDIIMKAKFSKLVDYMEAHPNVGACGYYVNVFGSNKGKIRQELSNDKIRAAMLFENQMDSLSMVRTSMFRDGVEYNEKFIPAEDYELWYEIMKKAELVNIPEFLLDYRLHGNNTSIEKKEIGEKNRLQVQCLIFKYLFTIDMDCDMKKTFEVLYNDNKTISVNIDFLITCLERLSQFPFNVGEINRNCFLYYLTRRWFIFCLKNKPKGWLSLLTKPNFVRIQFLFYFLYSMVQKKI